MYQWDGGTYGLWIPPLLHIPIWIYPQSTISDNGYSYPRPHGFYFHDSEVHGANMGPTWGRQAPGVPRVGPMNFAIWVIYISP